MSFEIKYFAADSKHITLNSDGSIEIYLKDNNNPIVIDYLQARLLKAMILAEYGLGKTEKQ